MNVNGEGRGAGRVHSSLRRDAEAEGEHQAVADDERSVRREVLAAEGHEEGGELDDPDVHELGGEAAHAHEATGGGVELHHLGGTWEIHRG